jgi:hypothetical protein
LSFLNDLKPFIVIRIRFTHAQPQDAVPLERDMVDDALPTPYRTQM